VFRGIGIALIGATATSLLIFGLTQAWFGRYLASTLALIASIVSCIIFFRTAKNYLDFLALRVEDTGAIAPEVVVSPADQAYQKLK